MSQSAPYWENILKSCWRSAWKLEKMQQIISACIKHKVLKETNAHAVSMITCSWHEEHVVLLESC